MGLQLPEWCALPAETHQCCVAAAEATLLRLPHPPSVPLPLFVSVGVLCGCVLWYAVWGMRESNPLKLLASCPAAARGQCTLLPLCSVTVRM
jgi:hypothetical protein